MAAVRRFARYLTDESASLAGRLFNLFMIALIVVSITVWLLDTHKAFAAAWGAQLRQIEEICMVFFIAEYLLRMVASDLPLWRYPFQPLAVVDALAILPFFLAGTANTAVLRLLRLFRIFRIFKLARYSESIHRLALVFRENAGVLGVFLFVIFVILMISAALMHTLEPERFAQMTDALWWSIVTLTTVGYGDIVPETLAGKFVAAVLMVFGIGIIALPTGVLGASMTRLMHLEKNTQSTTCARCGEAKHLVEARYCHRCGDRLQP